MTQTFIATTLLLALSASPILAQENPILAPITSTELEKVGLTPPTILSQGYEHHDTDRLTSNIVGQKVYTSAGTDAQTIGAITDMVLSNDNQIVAAIIDVGRFLAVGHKPIAVDFSQLQWVMASDGSFRFVMATDANALTNAPAFIWGESEAAVGAALTPAQEAAQMVDDPNATNNIDPNATTDQPPAETSQTDPSAKADLVGLTPLDASALTPAQLAGIAVYGTDAQIGTIGGAITNAEGNIDAVIIDVGGFLGLGAKPVAVAYQGLNFSTDDNDNRYLFLNATRTQLEAQTAYDPASYQANRTNQRMIITP